VYVCVYVCMGRGEGGSVVPFCSAVEKCDGVLHGDVVLWLFSGSEWAMGA
jgi:hypothetical protein